MAGRKIKIAAYEDVYDHRVQPWWLKRFISSAKEVREQRYTLRRGTQRLWREDLISMLYDQLRPDALPSDILGLRRLFGMSQYPNYTEDNDWDSQEAFSESPFIMLYLLLCSRIAQRSVRAMRRAHSF